MADPKEQQTVLSWTSFDPRQSQLFSPWGTLYRFDTDTTGGKTITTLWRAIKQGKEDRIARLEWQPNGGLGRAIIGRNTMSMADLVTPDGPPMNRTFLGPDGYQYWWTPTFDRSEYLLVDQGQNVIAKFRPIRPSRKYNIGEVHGELCFVSNAGAGTVLHPPLMDMVCITAMIYRHMHSI